MGKSERDQHETRNGPEADEPAPESMSTHGLSPGVWVTGLMVLVVLLLAVFALG